MCDLWCSVCGLTCRTGCMLPCPEDPMPSLPEQDNAGGGR